jgi:hypothetical protein
VITGTDLTNASYIRAEISQWLMSLKALNGFNGKPSILPRLAKSLQMVAIG